MFRWRACCRPWVDVSMDVGSTSDAAGAGGGFAALMVAANPSLTPEQMKAAMIAGADNVPAMQGQLVSNVSRTLSFRHLISAGMFCSKRNALHTQAVHFQTEEV